MFVSFYVNVNDVITLWCGSKKTRSFGGRDLWYQINSRVVWLAREHDSTQLLGVHCMFQLNAFHIANKKTECCFVMTYLSFLCVKIKNYRFTDSTNSDQKKKQKKKETLRIYNFNLWVIKNNLHLPSLQKFI